ncbi:MAG TPA: UPF0182 family protein, partial [Streptosporangiaceae bacterium]|nr:UPF0182 family protein [Streptosporangiaceae bacterium]
QNTFENDPAVSSQLSLWRQGGSTVVLGNLLALPFAQAFLYVEPVYLKAASGVSYPLLQRVLVSFGGTVGFAPSFGDALNQVVKGVAVAPPSGGNVAPGTLTTAVRQAIADAQLAFNAGQDALKKGDWTAYGVAQTKLQDAINRLNAALTAASKKPATTPTPSASASASAAVPTPTASHTP